jgi:hypothetical protein
MMVSTDVYLRQETFFKHQKKKEEKSRVRVKTEKENKLNIINNNNNNNSNNKCMYSSIKIEEGKLN